MILDSAGCGGGHPVPAHVGVHAPFVVSTGSTNRSWSLREADAIDPDLVPPTLVICTAVTPEAVSPRRTNEPIGREATANPGAA